MFEDLLGGLTSMFSGAPEGGGTGTETEGAGANPLASILLGVGAPLISKLMGQGTEKQITGTEKNLKTAGNTERA